MGGDYSKKSFDPKKDFSGVLMQQGRVQLDSDWNEQVEIHDRRWRAETTDVVGRCGVPKETLDGFKIGASGSKFTIAPGRIYVDGLLAENHGTGDPEFDSVLGEMRGKDALLYDEQPYYNKEIHEVEPLPQGGPHLVYIDVWQREVTHLKRPELIEKAVGVDTTTRLQTVWQVKVLPSIGSTATCMTHDDQIPGWRDVILPTAGRLTTEAVGVPSEEDLCQLPPTGGYRGLENQLYRVEIHDGGPVGTATFKWSRDNASVATSVNAIIGLDQLIVESTRRDPVLRFNIGDWVEITDDCREFAGKPGIIRKVKYVNDATNTITLETKLDAGEFPTDPDEQDKTESSRHTRIRRWDQRGEIRDSNGNLIIDLDAPNSAGVIPVPAGGVSIILEHGIQITLHTDARINPADRKFRMGDYWVFAARAATGEIEELDREPPQGINHHYCKLALVKWNASGKPEIEDCRPEFHPLTELINFFYISGDGQEAMPDEKHEKLPKPLQVGVANGQYPIEGAKVKFQIKEGNGSLQARGGPKTVDVTTGEDGVAECEWWLDDNTLSQQVEAILLYEGDNPIHLPIRFNANLSVASEVAYNPAGCANLEGADTVQEAIDKLCKMKHRGCCTSTVYDTETLVKALSTERCINICLLPGDYRIKKNLVSAKSDFIKITGCGSRGVINLDYKCDKFTLKAHEILLQDININVTNKTGIVSLIGNKVIAERCAFERMTSNKTTSPLVRVEPRQSVTDLTWRNNQMVAAWVELLPNMWDYFIPSIILPPTVKKNIKMWKEKLSKFNLYDNEQEFEKVLESAVQQINKISFGDRKKWYEKRPERKINTLPKEQREAVERFYNELKEESLVSKKMKEAIKAVFIEFYIIHYTDALAVPSGVGGWIENNIITGYVVLCHSLKGYSPLSWKKTDGQRHKKDSLEENLEAKGDLIKTVSAMLSLRGNDIYGVHSNASSLMEKQNGETLINKLIFKAGKWPKSFHENGFKSIHVCENAFRANGNSFVCETLVMNGNLFTAATDKNDVAVNVLGYTGIFMGNVAPNENSVIEKILVDRRTKDVANLMRIV